MSQNLHRLWTQSHNNSLIGVGLILPGFKAFWLQFDASVLCGSGALYTKINTPTGLLSWHSTRGITRTKHDKCRTYKNDQTDRTAFFTKSTKACSQHINGTKLAWTSRPSYINACAKSSASASRPTSYRLATDTAAKLDRLVLNTCIPGEMFTPEIAV